MNTHHSTISSSIFMDVMYILLVVLVLVIIYLATKSKTPNRLTPCDIEKSVKEAGLYPYEPAPLAEFPVELHRYCGKGIGLWQYPNQFAMYLYFIYITFPQIKTYGEIGVAAGGTFMFTTDFLRKHCGLQHSYAIDIVEHGVDVPPGSKPTPFQGLFSKYLKFHNDSTTFIKGDSLKFAKYLTSKNQTLDLLLIDGDHQYQSVKTDFQNMKGLAKIYVFHDIHSEACPGVRDFWAEMQKEDGYYAISLTQGYKSLDRNYLGIGILIPKSSFSKQSSQTKHE